jgi:GNAT superfamily N-acetyltransferase
MFDASPNPRTLLAQSPRTILAKLRSRLWSTRRSITLVLELPPATAPGPSDLTVSFADPGAVPDLTTLLPDTTGADLLILAAVERTRAAAAGELALARRGDALVGVHFIHTAPDQERLEGVAPALYGPLAADEALTEGVFVVPDARGLGVAPSMLHATAEELGRRGYRRALAVVDVANAPSLRAFAAAGYRPAGTMRVDRLRFGRRSSRFTTATTDLRRRYARAVGAVADVRA